VVIERNYEWSTEGQWESARIEVSLVQSEVCGAFHKDRESIMTPNRKPTVGLGTPLPTQASGAQRRSSSAKFFRRVAEALRKE